MPVPRLQAQRSTADVSWFPPNPDLGRIPRLAGGQPTIFLRPRLVLVERIAVVKRPGAASARASGAFLLEQQRHHEVFFVVQVTADSQTQAADRGDELLRGYRARGTAGVRITLREGRAQLA